MVDRKANYGILSCANRTVLFIRDRRTSVVYLSQQYGPCSRLILAVFSLFAASLKLIDVEDFGLEQITATISEDTKQKK